MTAPPPAPGTAPPARAHRFRSARRVPAALTAAAVLGAAALFLYDIAAVRAHRPGMAWRRDLADRLAGHTLADTGVVVTAVVLILAGALLLVLALTPGLRAVLPMQGPEGLRAGLTRKGAGLIVRDRAMEVAGVQSVKVRVGRTRIGVRVSSHFRELDEVHEDLEAVLAVAVAELGLAHPPHLHVRVARPARKE
ncbi:DUF6286 domain-containing protein [Streptomyces bambusae]|uniref:DUF6286 domain-containing protein n=1 Tax=Streptomyces bambusae TaxID=1550616 RepID=UPI001CFD99C7|nr:DUF6286 domain-containing protein [Streptomyces bambusae]MCB5168122.1 DUF6286 domain-containing protein [Streptomyces bambusae]